MAGLSQPRPPDDREGLVADGAVFVGLVDGDDDPVDRPEDCELSAKFKQNISSGLKSDCG